VLLQQQQQQEEAVVVLNIGFVDSIDRYRCISTVGLGVEGERKCCIICFNGTSHAVDMKRVLSYTKVSYKLSGTNW
jgi:hypothetical protein